MISPAANGVSPVTVTIFDVIVIGGGLSGLVVAHGLIGNQRVKNWKLLEASDRLGGRLFNADPNVSIDMGGAWIWPDHQPHIRELVSKLSLRSFVQPDDPSSFRIEGGAVRLIEQLSKQIKSSENESIDSHGFNVMNRIALSTPIVSCKLLNGQNYSDDVQPLVQLTTNDGEIFVSRKVVFAVPPKIISDTIAFDPPLSSSKTSAMAESKTWMAGVTKVALLYSTKFWTSNESNASLPLSMGPAFQVYDSSTKDSSLVALTFFVHVPTQDDDAQTDDKVLAKQVAGQMAKLWKNYGMSEYYSKAHSYSSFYVYRLPMNRYVSGDDTRPAQIHPHPKPTRALSTPEWDNRLYFASTEADLTSPGVMEGAVSAAKRVLKSLFD